LGSVGGIFMAKLANLASFFAFAFAFYFSCQLTADVKKTAVKVWQKVVFVALATYSLYINLVPNLTVENVTISGPSQFVIEFGPH
ncbi:hybrid sensor histidine kinase/response regulator, partial [Vibrio parahaemolyticus]|nr:hybrid sensor histidine kinase/response regulator [Vibrio parahaemolyticus]